MLQIGRALGPQVDNDVQNATARASHQFRLGGRWKLEMHSAHCALLAVVSDIDLRNDRLQPMRLEFFFAECAGEEAALVFPALQIDEKGPFQLGLSENQVSVSFNFWMAAAARVRAD